MADVDRHRPIFYGQRLVGCRCGVSVDDRREFEEHMDDVVLDVVEDRFNSKGYD